MKKLLLLVIFLGLFTAADAQRFTQPGYIKDVAGKGGPAGYGGDDDDATKAQLNHPMGLAMDRYGNLYIADTRNHRIRKVEIRTGNIKTVAGTGKPGFFNDGGPAENATLYGPTGLAFDNWGNLFIADTGNHRIRVLTNKGYLKTVAGTGQQGYSGEREMPQSAFLNNPTGLAFNSQGELHFSDTGNNRIRKLERGSRQLVTVAGTGFAGNRGDKGPAANADLNRPMAIIFDKNDNLFIADTRNHQVRLVPAKLDMVITVAGTGTEGFSGDNSRNSNDSQFDDPTGLALDRNGALYIADTDNQRIRRASLQGNRITKVETIVGTGVEGYNGDDFNAWDAKVSFPGQMLITPADQLFFVDSGNNLIRRVQAISRINVPVPYNKFGVKEEPQTEKRTFFEALFGIKKKVNKTPESALTPVSTSKPQEKPVEKLQTIVSNQLTVKVAAFGAELHSIQGNANHKEYLWHGDPAYWKRRSPVLFPIVGKLWENQYRVDGNTYTLSQHGFARDSEFTLIAHTPNEVRYRLSSNEETLKKYPFHFLLDVGYRVEGNRVEVFWWVKNTGNKTLYFQIGAHPAFLYPDFDPKTTARGFIGFGGTNQLSYSLLTKDGCVAPQKYPLRLNQNGLFPLDVHTFDREALVFENPSIKSITLLTNQRKPYISLFFHAPAAGLWSPQQKNAPFICIEPWYGRGDACNYTGEYKDRDYTEHLPPGEVFQASYVIEIHDAK